MTSVDKENTITDSSAMKRNEHHAALVMKDKKSRSKSLGPGGVGALQNANGNRRKSTASVPLKSILKPTMPISPVRKIPPFEDTRKQIQTRRPQQKVSETDEGDSKKNREGQPEDFGPPSRQLNARGNTYISPFDTFNASSAIAAAREQEEIEQREREWKMILEQREARRKSMASRRVSFAPEATLHTWNIVEIADDSTASSNSNSTRRGSTLAASANNESNLRLGHRDYPSSPGSENDSDIAFSPVPDDHLQQLRNHPVSIGSYIGSNQGSSSPFGGSSIDGSDGPSIHGTYANSSTPSPVSDPIPGDEGTPTSVNDLATRPEIVAQERSGASNEVSTLYDQVSYQSALETGASPIDAEDEDGEISMEIADQEITGAFQPWIRKGQRQSFDWGDISVPGEQKDTSISNQPTVYPREPGLTESGGAGMEMISNVGDTLTSGPHYRRRTSHQKPSDEEINVDEETMDFTNSAGVITQSDSHAKSMIMDSDGSDEEMTMEFTSVVGGVISKNPASGYGSDQANNSAFSSHTTGAKGPDFSEWNSEGDDMEIADMEITRAVGGILSPIHEQLEDQGDDRTMGMDTTTAIGKILPRRLEENNGDRDKKKVEFVTAVSELGSSPFREIFHQPPAKKPASFRIAAMASESGSPSLANVESRGQRSSLGEGEANTTPVLKPEASPLPAKRLTPPGDLVLSLRKCYPANSSVEDKASPKKPFQSRVKQQTDVVESPEQRDSFDGNMTAGEWKPSFILHPRRRSSGLGIDKEGLGSPRVAEILDTRRPITDEISRFQLGDLRHQDVRFEDPVKLLVEVNREREEEEYREDGHISSAAATRRDTALSLREMIASLTPKKNRPGSRKSLHAGSALGLLGKRPIELDEDDDKEPEYSPKRRKGGGLSPTGDIRLPGPGTMGEAVSPSRRSPFRSCDALRFKKSATPIKESKGRTLSASLLKESDPPNLQHGSPAASRENTDVEEELCPMQLQEFLNMTNIHFMELTTTKRRHTTTQESTRKREDRLTRDNAGMLSSFEDCVAAGFCKVPMLELFQHSCRELRSYISEGRQVIRSIETETYADNPPLFSEYVKAPPDIRLLMDNQFRNVKTHARLLSKATWYDWRMKLLEGLKSGLSQHTADMKVDSALLTKYETLLSSIVPELAQKHLSLEKEATAMQELVDEIENCDKAKLRDTREELARVDEEIALKRRQLEEMQSEYQNKIGVVQAGAKHKAELIAQIQESERVKEEYRGWGAKEIIDLRSSVHETERRTGWTIVSAYLSHTDPRLIMSYRGQLQLSFNPGAFDVRSAPNVYPTERLSMPLDLTYLPERDTGPSAGATKFSPTTSLILKYLQKYLPTINQPKTPPRKLLDLISGAWKLVFDLEEEARLLSFHGMTDLKLIEDEENHCIRVRCILIDTASKLPGKKPNRFAKSKRIDLDFFVTAHIIGAGDNSLGNVDFETAVTASKVYGFGKENEHGVSESKLRDILSEEMRSRLSDGAVFGEGVWYTAVRVLAGRVF